MKIPIVAFLAIITLAVILPPTSLNAQKDVSQEIMQANEHFMQLFETGDVDKFVTVYTADARLLPPNGPVVSGLDNLKAFWKGMMEAGVSPKLKTISAEGYGKTAIEEGVVEIYADDKVVDHVKYVVIWKKVKGSWKMHKDIWNSDKPIPGVRSQSEKTGGVDKET